MGLTGLRHLVLLAEGKTAQPNRIEALLKVFLDLMDYESSGSLAPRPIFGLRAHMDVLID